jgi:heme exporter protein A
MLGPVIESDGVGRRFASVAALHGVTLRVTAGEAVAVFGPNGAGKTTLLRVLATLLRPSEGTLRLFGRPARDAGVYARRHMGFLSHKSFLYPDLTPAQNLDFYARMFGVPARAERVRDLLDQVGLLGWAHRPVRALSRGLEQRCALARALVHDPELLLLDEPFSGLDVDAATMLSELLHQARGRGTTVLMTTHDIARGFEICTRAVILAQGRPVWDGNIAAARRDEFEEIYHGAVQGEA